MAAVSRRNFHRYSLATGLSVVAGSSPRVRPALAAAPRASDPRSGVGSRTRAEWTTYKDRQTGVEVVQLTNYKGHSHHFYFTNSGWYDGGRKLLFSSDRANRTNLYGIDLATGEIEQVTDLEPVPLPRELEFFRACKNPACEEVYFWHDLSLMAVDLKSKQARCLYRLDPGWCVSMSNCSADGKHVFFGVWQDLSDKIRTDLARGYVGFKETWEARPLSRIFQVATVSGKAKVVFEEKYWIGHVNTSPTQRNLLTFCHEGPASQVDQRIWGLDADTGRVWKLRPVSGKEAVVHEYWYADGLRVGYHGRDAQDNPMIGRIRHDGADRHETSFPGRTGHTFSLDERLVVGDGGGVIRLWRLDATAYAPPRVLCRHDSSMRIQQAHPHPRISPDGKYVVYTSDCSGYCNVYKVGIADFDTLPLADAK